ncbi:hypothetical protein DFO53_3574 [Enterobacter sp. AG5470]|nr:hypothetical protein DFO53_3574 [Enterobacter sp. AG5470]
MSFKSFFASLSTLELVCMLFGIAAPIVCIILIFFTFRGNSTSIRAATMYLKRDKWPGELHKSRVEAWQQTNTMYGNDYFFDIFFHLDGVPELYSAKALIMPSQMHLLQKGLPIIVKKGKNNRIAVMQIGE